MKRRNVSEFWETLKRGLRSRCPKCGEGKLFKSWNVLHDTCAKCGCVLSAREDETWFFMYVSTAFITGLFIISMFLIMPMHQDSSRWTIALIAVVVFLATTGPRKGIAIAIDYFIDAHSQFPRK